MAYTKWINLEDHSFLQFRLKGTVHQLQDRSVQQLKGHKNICQRMYESTTFFHSTYRYAYIGVNTRVFKKVRKKIEKNN